MYPRISLRNGHHTMISQPPKRPRSMVMFETQDHPEFRHLPSFDDKQPGLRRLRFSFFNSIVKEQPSQYRLLLTMEAKKRRTHSPWVSPVSRTTCSCESRARIGRRSNVCPERVPNKHYRPFGVNNLFSFFSSGARKSHKTLKQKRKNHCETQ